MSALPMFPARSSISAQRNSSGNRHPTPSAWHRGWQHGDATRQSTARRELQLGLCHYAARDLEAARASGEMLHIRVLGLASFAADVSPDLARATIGSLTVLGAFHASPEVKVALADRTTTN